MISWPLIISGFALGAAGSLHCAGMCGPLSLALPTRHLSAPQKFFSLLLYQFGRICTYAVIGLLFGLAGRRIYISGYQQWFSIGLGILVIALALLYFAGRRSIRFPFINRLYGNVSRLIGSLLGPNPRPLRFGLLGVANGLLPCGMVYVAVAATLSLTRVTDSVLFMALFGAGTLPMMMGVAYAGQMLKTKTRLAFRQWIPYFVVLMGMVLILRGLNLGIPFISPELPQSPGSAVVCHT